MSITPASRTVVIVGLVVALVLPTIFALAVNPLGESIGADLASVLGLVVMWLLAAVVVVLVLRGEKRGLSSTGVRPTSALWVLAAVGIGIGLSLLVPLLSLAASTLLPATGGGVIEAASRPWPLLLLAVITAAVTEEVLFRGYAIERMLELTGSRVAAVAVPLAFFTVMHAGSWNPAHVLGVVLPLGLALSLLYLWKRNLLIVIVAHLIVDLPLVVIAALNS